ncbi:TPA: hypothetical protein ACXI3L_004585 [Serratia marcescens]|nr:hypothetical protein [Serratia marcescens]HEJ8033628.1 hypothetical protein [Serratia marcescens]
MTLTTEQLRARAESLGLDFFIERRAGVWVKEWLNNGCTSATAEEVMMWSMLANREAQPVAWRYRYRRGPHKGTWIYVANESECATRPLHEKQALYTAPPAPAVPDAIITAPIEAMRCGPAACYVLGWNAYRAAMLAQPVSGGYKLPDNVREALTLALQAMEFMGDTLNNIDAVCTEDVEYVTPAFNAVRELLAAVPGVGN